MSSAQRQIFVIARVFNIMQFDNMLQERLIAVIAVTRNENYRTFYLLGINLRKVSK